MFKGSITALITPFKDGGIDWNSFEKLIEWQIDQGSHGLVPVGTTGECPTVSHDDHMAIVERCVQVVNGRIPVIAGTGSNSTSEAIALARAAKDVGADGHLSVVPYYNKPTQDGLSAHFKAIHDAVDLPMVLYNIPGRCVVDMADDTVARLAELGGVVGIKDATNDLSRVRALREMVGDGFAILSAEDATAPGLYALGGDGCISVLSNVVPAMSAGLWNSWKAGDLAEFTRLRDLTAPLARDLFCESSPAPVKYALSRMGFGSDEVRLPLLRLSDAGRAKVDAAMAHAGVKP